MERVSGIYAIKNLYNSKMYIGKSINIYERWKKHLYDLKTNRHHSHYLQNSFNKYGESAFVFGVIRFCPPDVLDKEEKGWIDFYDTYNTGYNEALPNGKNSGRIFSDEDKANHARISREVYAKYPEKIKNRVKKRLAAARKLIDYSNFKGPVQNIERDGVRVQVYSANTLEKLGEFKNYYKCAEWMNMEESKFCKKMDKIRSMRTKKFMDMYFIFNEDTIDKFMERVLLHRKDVLLKVNPLRNNKRKGKPILQLDLDGNLIKEWPKLADARASLGLSKSAISSVLSGIQKQTGGYKWAFK